MYGVSSNAGFEQVAMAAGAAWLAGMAIKLVDGVVDGEAGFDPAAAASYAAALLAASAALAWTWAVSLVASAWAIGMADRRLDPAWVEGVALVALAGALTGWREVGAALLALGAVQSIDHWVDREALPRMAGIPRVALLGAGISLAAAGAAVDPLKTGLVLLFTPACERMARALAGRTFGIRRRPGANGHPMEGETTGWTP